MHFHPHLDRWVQPQTCIPVALLYLLAIYVLHRAMRHHQPLDLAQPMRLYNVLQIVLNLYMVQGLAASIPSVYNPFGLHNPLSAHTEWFVVVHYLSKLMDFVDTLCIVLRKKDAQLTFLHLYHHSTILPVWGYTLWYGNGSGTIFYGAFINSVIHLLMYTHYLVTSLGYNNPFKRYLTQLQLVQFVTCILHAVLVLRYETVIKRHLALYQLGYHVTMIVLFTHFYRRSYKSKKAAARSQQQHQPPEQLIDSGKAVPTPSSASGHAAHRLHTIIENNMYDITDFVSRHPGGDTLLKLAIGRDCTYEFWSYHLNQPLVRQQLAQLQCLGPVDQPTAYKKPDTLFALQRLVLSYLRREGLAKRGGVMHRTVFYTVTAIALAYLVIVRHCWYLAPLLGVVMSTIGLAIQHSANHGSLSSSSYVNQLCGWYDDFIGGSSFMWLIQHNIGHHVLPNDHDEDPDTYKSHPILRFHQQDSKQWYHRYQSYYIHLLFCFLPTSYWFMDFWHFLTGYYGHVKIPTRSLSDFLAMTFFKLLHVYLFLYVPYTQVGDWWSICLVHSCGGLYLALLFALSHNTYTIQQQSYPSDDWAACQIMESSNWCAASKLANFLTGGLNQQIEHHLFPALADHHYPKVAHIVKQYCQQPNVSIPYCEYKTLTANYVDMIKFLNFMGR